MGVTSRHGWHGIGRRMIAVVVACLLVVAPAAQASEAALKQAEQALNAGEAAAARDLLAALETDYAGDPRFDYLYGLALLETGSPGRALFVFERVLAVEPDFLAARMELGRAHYALNDLDSAEAEFLTLRDMNPPPAAERAIEEYLALIRSRRDRGRAQWELRAGLSTGYDTNANSATTVPTFLGFDLNETSRETDSPFVQYEGNARVTRALRGGLTLDSRLSLSHRTNADAGFVDGTTAVGNVALRHVREGRSLTLALSGYRLNVDGDLNSQGLSLNGGFEIAVNRAWRVGATARLGATRFDEGLEVKDVDQFLLGGNATWTLGAKRRASLGATVLVGRDEAVERGSRYSRDLVGLRLDGNWTLNPRFRLFATVSGTLADYDEIFFEQQFDSPREDTLGQATLGLDWRVSRHWLLRHMIVYHRNVTDVQIFEFDRLQTSLQLLRIWR